MNRKAIDPTMRSQLDNLETEMELCDENGRTIGFFIPAAETDPALYKWANQQFTEDEIEAARRDPRGFSISEVMKGLGD